MNNRFIHIIFLGVLAIVIASCTSARWTVVDEKATDQSDYEVLEQDHLLMKSEEITPQNPVLTLDLMARTKYKYTQRILAERTIQEYRPRFGYMALGISGAALAFYTANSGFLSSTQSSTTKWTLNAAGAVLATSGFLNMKAVGEPRPTGEERYLRSTGSITQIDTVQVNEEVKMKTNIRIQYGDITMVEEEDSIITNGSLEIPLAEELSNLDLKGSRPGEVNVFVDFNGTSYTYDFPISNILQPYARVTSQLTSLRNSPDETSDNIVADLVEGSQVKIESSENEDWFRVLYGISEHYMLKDDSEIVWQPSDFAQKDQIVTVPQASFGEIDVESNIPILRGKKENTLALILTNENYSGDFEKRNYAHRDGQLVKTYLQNALGYPEDNIYEVKDASNSFSIGRILSEMRFTANDSTEVMIYLSGYGSTFKEGEKEYLGLLGTNKKGESPNRIVRLKDLYGQLSSITSGKTLVLNDLDFSHSHTTGDYSPNRAQQILEFQVEELTRKNSNAAVLFGTRLTQPSSLYVSSTGDDKKHHIFPYFFAKALQQRKTDLSVVYQFLERNISYTTRKLHDRPQDPLLLGNTLLDLRSD